MLRDDQEYYSQSYCLGGVEIWVFSIINTILLALIIIYHFKSKEGKKELCGMKSWLLTTLFMNELSVILRYSINDLSETAYLVLVLIENILQSFNFLMLCYLFVNQGLKRVE